MIGCVGVFRTPEERFAGLPGFQYEPSYAEVGGLRLGRVDTGEGSPVVMLHGEPAWSYVWRRVMPPLLDAGHRCIALDHAGFGRSDKPTDPGWHSLDRHVELTIALVEQLDLRDATLVIHDWGGPIGAHTALALPDRIARLVILDTVLDVREPWKTDAWVRFRTFVERTHDFPVAEAMRATCFTDPGDEVVTAYEAPYPSPEAKAALTGLPLSVPRPGDDPAAEAEAERLYEGLRSDPRPVLMLWAEHDMFLTLATGERLATRIGRSIDRVLPEAGHGLQEDQGPLIGRLIAEWLAR